MSSSEPQALLLAAHGSAQDPAAAEPVLAHARRIRARGLFERVEVGFYKQAPFLTDALAPLAAFRTFVVPMFLADGHYVRTVVPRLLALGARRAAGARVHYCRPIGLHPAVPGLVARRALEVARAGCFDPRDAALIVLGHGTERHPRSGASTYRIVERLRRRSRFAAVDAAFLDQAPLAPEVVERQTARHVVIVPFLLADGWHTRHTVPEMLGLTGTRTVQQSRVLWYTPPVGTLPAVARLAVENAVRSGARLTRTPAFP